MKAKIFPILMVLAVLLSPAYAQLGSQSFAKPDFKDSTVTEAEIELASTAFSDPGILPDHPLYFIKRLGEGLRVMLALNPEDKAKLHLELAKTRLGEVKKMVEMNKVNDIKKQVEQFSIEIEALGNSSKGIGKNVSAIAQQTEDVLEKSVLVLNLVAEKVPEQAKAAIENAINNSLEKRIKIEIDREGKGDEDENEIGEKIREGIRKNLEVREELKKRTSRTRETGESGHVVTCIQVITPARNTKTGEIKEFPTPCDVPEGWEKIEAPEIHGDSSSEAEEKENPNAGEGGDMMPAINVPVPTVLDAAS